MACGTRIRRKSRAPVLRPSVTNNRLPHCRRSGRLWHLYRSSPKRAELIGGCRGQDRSVGFLQRGFREGKVSNVDVMRGLYDAFSQGDIPTVLGGMDPNIEWREAEGNPYQPSGDPWRGPDAILNNLFVKLGAEWDGTFAVHPKDFHDAGDTVVVEARYTGTYKATGKELDAQVCHVWKLHEGKVISFQQFVDTGQMQAVMGAS